jgi:hypothetical protein
VRAPAFFVSKLTLRSISVRSSLFDLLFFFFSFRKTSLQNNKADKKTRAADSKDDAH